MVVTLAEKQQVILQVRFPIEFWNFFPFLPSPFFSPPFLLLSSSSPLLFPSCPLHHFSNIFFYFYI